MEPNVPNVTDVDIVTEENIATQVSYRRPKVVPSKDTEMFSRKYQNRSKY